MAMQARTLAVAKTAMGTKRGGPASGVPRRKFVKFACAALLTSAVPAPVLSLSERRRKAVSGSASNLETIGKLRGLAMETFKAELEKPPKTASEISSLNKLLHSACYYGDVRTVEFLLENGAELEGRNSSGGTPLITAAEAGNTKVARLLLSRGADPNARNDSRDTPMLVAACGGKAAVVRLLLSKGADPDAQNSEGKTALMHSAYNADLMSARALLGAKAEVECSDKEGHNSLYHAFDLEPLESGLCSSYGCIGSIPVPGSRKMFENKMKIAELLLARGISDGASALAKAVEWGAVRGVKLVLNKAKDLEEEDLSEALIGAASLPPRFAIPICRMLLNKGAVITDTDEEGNTALHRANHPRVARFLIKRGADVHARNDEGETALNQVMGYDDELSLAMAKVLRKHGSPEDEKVVPPPAGLQKLCSEIGKFSGEAMSPFMHSVKPMCERVPEFGKGVPPQ